MSCASHMACCKNKMLCEKPKFCPLNWHKRKMSLINNGYVKWYHNVYSLFHTDKLLPEIMKCVECSADHVHKVAISALWALVYNNQKVCFIFHSLSIFWFFFNQFYIISSDNLTEINCYILALEVNIFLWWPIVRN
jgi:hypothetical protein